MKKYLIAVATALIFSGCENHKAELESSNRQRDSLMQVLNGRDSTLNDFLQSYTEIQQNLDSVSRRGTTISENMQNKTELKGTAKERINDDILAINNLMNENREKIADLSKKLKRSGSKNKKLEAMIQTLQDQITEKDKELADLNDKLVALNANVAQLQTSVDTLTSQNTSQSQTIAEQTTSLHTAYYVVGKSKELQEMKVIDKTGGLLGMGKSSKLSTNFDNSHFTRIDYTQTNSIDINSKDAKIVTTHPAGSYIMDKDSKNMIPALRITDPEKFWSASKYLVIVKD